MWVDVPAFVERCVYIDGVHVYGAPDCAHSALQREDEMGEIVPDGWTVQS